jgi:hypothetical protein
MIELRQGLGFATKARPPLRVKRHLGGEHFKRDVGAQLRFIGRAQEVA